jgi:CheY-like chemotaxis protein
MDGGELCKRLKAMPEFANVPIIVHTSSRPPEGNGTNWQDYLGKPIDATVFLTAVATLVKDAGNK